MRHVLWPQCTVFSKPARTNERFPFVPIPPRSLSTGSILKQSVTMAVTEETQMKNVKMNTIGILYPIWNLPIQACLSQQYLAACTDRTAMYFIWAVFKSLALPKRSRSTCSHRSSLLCSQRPRRRKKSTLRILSRT